MKKTYIIFALFLLTSFSLRGQNKVGLGTTTPEGKFHIKGSDDVSQLIIDAYTTQTNPLIRLRSQSGDDLMGRNIAYS